MMILPWHICKKLGCVVSSKTCTHEDIYLVVSFWINVLGELVRIELLQRLLKHVNVDLHIEIKLDATTTRLQVERPWQWGEKTFFVPSYGRIWIQTNNLYFYVLLVFFLFRSNRDFILILKNLINNRCMYKATSNSW